MAAHFSRTCRQLLVKIIFQEVFEPLKSTHKYANDHVYVIVPSEFIKNRINRLYLGKINTLAQKFNQAPIRFKFVTASEMIPEETLISPERNLSLKISTW
ncbi:MAG: hypothetical protein LRY20_00615 [Acholeplasmataceae bacterium]|nr:hypothetical protein [Acholeplasmataceae bacterium]